MKRFFTSESVTEGHPDKICDRISDAVLDAILTQDPVARVACETCVTTGMVLIMGEITTNCYVEIPKIVRDVINGIGYDRAKYGFDGSTCSVLTSIEDQSADIALGVDRDGAGDQGMMFGFACDETNTLMPMPIYFAHELSKKLTDVRKQGTLGFLRPDGKTQVTVEYENDRPVRISEIVISAQHSPVVSYDSIREGLIEEVIKPIIPEGMTDSNTKIFVNPTGQFVVGGPQGDSGLTGRKIIVDTYGGYARHGGGAFSGKDPTKVDRSASYMTRYIAKNLVKAGIAKKCEIQVAYVIGVADPVSISVETFGTGIMSDEQVTKIVREVFDLRPRAIIEQLDLRKPIYQPLSAYGHMGREELGVKWEICDRVNDILEAAKHV